jgi:hypothetical protein
VMVIWDGAPIHRSNALRTFWPKEPQHDCALAVASLCAGVESR